MYEIIAIITKKTHYRHVLFINLEDYYERKSIFISSLYKPILFVLLK